MVLLRLARRIVAPYVTGKSRTRKQKRVTIGALPDDVLLDIFEFYRAVTTNEPDPLAAPWPWPWNRLVHVCQRWRVLVFASPLHLGLCLRCTSKTPVKEMLDVWPPLPLEILWHHDFQIGGNIIAAFKHRDRVCRIWISNLSSSLEEQLATVMPLGPFPALKVFELCTSGLSSPTLPDAFVSAALPDAFLGGSAPRLQTLSLCGISFPGLPRLLLSASELVNLNLWYIPDTGYIPSEAMITGLAGSTRLQSLVIEFASPSSHPHQRSRRPPPQTRVVLPALTEMEFRGVSKYLDDLVSGIDAPQLDRLSVSFFFNQLIFDIPQLSRFIGHAGVLRSYNRAELTFCPRSVEIVFNQHGRAHSPKELSFTVLCSGVERQVRSMAQICDQCSCFLSIVEQLDFPGYIIVRESTQQVDMDDTQWLGLFRTFTAVRTLRISPELHSFIIPVLQELTGERATEVLPALDSLHLDTYYPSTGADQQAIELFIAARRRSGHPVTIYQKWTSFRVHLRR